MGSDTLRLGRNYLSRIVSMLCRREWSEGLGKNMCSAYLASFTELGVWQQACTSGIDCIHQLVFCHASVMSCADIVNSFVDACLT